MCSLLVYIKNGPDYLTKENCPDDEISAAEFGFVKFSRSFEVFFSRFSFMSANLMVFTPNIPKYFGGARGVMVIVTGYGPGDPSSDPGQD